MARLSSRIIQLSIIVLLVVVATTIQLTSARKSEKESSDTDNSMKDFKKIYEKHVGKDWDNFYKLIMSILKLSTNSCLENKASQRSDDEEKKKELEERLKKKFQKILINFLIDKCSKEQHDEPESES